MITGLPLGISGATVKVRFFEAGTEKVWNGAAYEDWSDANVASYGIAAAEMGTSGRYKWTVPATVLLTGYSWEARQQPGASAAPNDPLVGAGDPANVLYVAGKPAVPANGGGAFVVTVTVTATPGGAAVVGASVRFSVAGGSYTATTDGSGVATFNLDLGTYTLSITKAGLTFAPVSVDVAGATNFPKQMTVVAVSPAADPAQTTGFLTTRDGSGNPQGNVTILFRLVGPVGATGTAFDGRDFSATSDGNGLLQVALMQSKHYKARHAAKVNSEWVDIPNTGTASTFQLPEILSATGT
jgi:hypothetical protein